jgi:hypothetical protein
MQLMKPWQAPSSSLDAMIYLGPFPAGSKLRGFTIVCRNSVEAENLLYTRIALFSNNPQDSVVTADVALFNAGDQLVTPVGGSLGMFFPSPFAFFVPFSMKFDRSMWLGFHFHNENGDTGDFSGAVIIDLEIAEPLL